MDNRFVIGVHRKKHETQKVAHIYDSENDMKPLCRHGYSDLHSH